MWFLPTKQDLIIKVHKVFKSWNERMCSFNWVNQLETRITTIHESEVKRLKRWIPQNAECRLIKMLYIWRPYWIITTTFITLFLIVMGFTILKSSKCLLKKQYLYKNLAFKRLLRLSFNNYRFVTLSRLPLTITGILM